METGLGGGMDGKQKAPKGIFKEIQIQCLMSLSMYFIKGKYF